ncbi:MAG: nucleotidyltransferase family protein [Coriobacteriia bacterium]|nr:nucleotidyltransferase family protein [Coriobacteriia bacterium]
MQTQTTKIDAIVLAGGDGSVIDPQASVKGMIQIAGKPMVQWVVEALRRADSIRNIAVVLPPGQDSSPWEQFIDHLVLSDGQISENMAAGLDVLPPSDFIVGVTSDIPTLTPEAIDDLCAQTIARRADLAYPLLREAAMLADYPGAQRTFVKIRGGKVTGGNAVVFNPHNFQRLYDFAQSLFDVRKSPLKLASIAGPKFVFKLAAGNLDVRDVERRLKQLLDVDCAAIFSEHTSIGADVDKPADLAVAQTHLLSIIGDE